jgi:hypothetical protein
MEVYDQWYQDKTLADEEFNMPFKTGQSNLRGQVGDVIESK